MYAGWSTGDGKFKHMIFDGGDGCGGDIKRMTKVEFKCATSASEQSDWAVREREQEREREVSTK
jgi:hypothetical protein